MPRKIAPIVSLASIALVCSMIGHGARAADQAAIQAATQAADGWLALVDGGKFDESWEQASGLFKDHVTKEQWDREVAAVRKPLGRLVSRKPKLAKYETSMPGGPDGQYVVIQYDSSFADKKSAAETVTPMLEKDGHWRVSGYYIK